MQKRRLTLLSALALSLLLHFVLVAGGEITLPDFYTSPDAILERKEAGKVQRVQLRSAPPAAKAGSGLRYVKATKASTSVAKAKNEKTAAKEPVKMPSDEIDVPAETEALAENPPATETPQVEEAVAPPPPEPAPAFPIQVSATLAVRYNGIPATLRQNWFMEGFRYSIELSGSKFGFRAQLSSEGRINAEGGLIPEHYRTVVNQKLKSSCDQADGVIHYGKVGNPKSAPLPVVAQDMASLPFHVAVTFNGQPQSIFVCTGNSVSQVRLTVDAEEKIKLPAGVLRTLHLTGERFNEDLGRVTRNYEVWLALDYLNYPVKFIGHTNNGDRIEYSLKSMEMEGKLVLGTAESDAEPVAQDEAIPEWIRRRAQQEDLNKP